jgi:hypothetical protein
MCMNPKKGKSHIPDRVQNQKNSIDVRKEDNCNFSSNESNNYDEVIGGTVEDLTLAGLESSEISERYRTIN